MRTQWETISYIMDYGSVLSCPKYTDTMQKA